MHDTYRGDIPRLFKIGRKESFLLATYGINEIYGKEDLINIEDAIRELADDYDSGWEMYLNKLADYLYHSRSIANRPNAPVFEFMFGIYDRYSLIPYRILNYRISTNGITLVNASDGPHLRIEGVSVSIPKPSDRIMDASPDELCEMSKNLVETVIETGKRYEEIGLTDYYPVGGKVLVESLP